MARTTVKADNGDRAFVVCDRCGFFLDGARDCGYCGEPACPVCGCFCGHHPGEADDDADADAGRRPHLVSVREETTMDQIPYALALRVAERWVNAANTAGYRAVASVAWERSLGSRHLIVRGPTEDGVVPIAAIAESEVAPLALAVLWDELDALRRGIGEDR